MVRGRLLVTERVGRRKKEHNPHIICIIYLKEEQAASPFRTVGGEAG